MQTVAVRDSLQVFLDEVARYPVLSKEKEHELAVKYHESSDIEAAKTLVSSNLRFVIKIATRYATYGYPLLDLIQEGTIGLMMAVRKFNPYKGTRLITYGVWWIKVYIQNYIKKTCSLVKMGASNGSGKLSLKSGNKSGSRGDKTRQPGQNPAVRESLEGLIDTEFSAFRRDLSLDAVSGEDDSLTYLDLLEDTEPLPEEVVEHVEMKSINTEGLKQGLECLTPRERYIIEKRYNSDPPMKLRELGDELGISKERVRQIESQSLLKLRSAINGYIDKTTYVDTGRPL